jgi:hypothetical protein
MSRPLLRSALELRPRCAASPAAAAAAAPLRPFTTAARRLFNSTPPIVDAPLAETPEITTPPPKAQPPRAPKKQQPKTPQSAAPAGRPHPFFSDAADAYPRIIPRKQTLKHRHPLIINPPRPGPAFGPPALPPAKPRHPSVAALLPVLAAQPSRYITVHIFDRPYLVTAGDQVRLPFLMQGVLPGDVLRLNRASVLGSRDYTLKGAPYIDERLYECRATVLGVESEPMRLKTKTKQRNRRVHTVKSKHRYTLLRISEVKVVVPEEEEGGGVVAAAAASSAGEGEVTLATAEDRRTADLAAMEKAGGGVPLTV